MNSSVGCDPVSDRAPGPAMEKMRGGAQGGAVVWCLDALSRPPPVLIVQVAELKAKYSS